MEDFKYTSINWSGYFYIDENSPSGLSRSKDCLMGFNKSNIRHRKDSPAGSAIWRNDTLTSGWTVHIGKHTYSVHRILWLMRHGSLTKGMVIDHLDGNPLNNSFNNLQIKTVRANYQNKKKRSDNKSGYQGVCLSGGRWFVRWTDIAGKNKSKVFSVKRYGNDEALRLALEYRKEQIEILNNGGMEYTQRHIGDLTINE